MANELILTAEVAKLEVKKGTRVFNKYAAIEDGVLVNHVPGVTFPCV